MSAKADVQRCADMLKKAGSDTEKFAALLMVTKLVNAADCGEEERKQLFDAIGFKYLLRMLGSPAPPGCPPELFRSIALTILSCFSQDESVSGSPAMAEAVPLICDVLREASGDEEQLVMLSDGYQCLEAAARAGGPARAALLAAAPVTLLVDVICSTLCGAEAAWRLLRRLLRAERAAVWRGRPELFTRLMRSLTMDLQLEETEQRWTLCADLRVALLSAPEPLPESEPDQWRRPLLDALLTMLTSRLTAQQRGPVLLLTAAVVEVLGVRHTALEPDRQRQLVMVYTNLFCIEIRMGLEDRTLAQAVKHSELLTSSFLVLEKMFEMLIGESPIEFDAKQRQQLIVAMRGACGAVITFLTAVMKEDAPELSRTQTMFIYSCIRVALAWLAEETAYPDEVLHLVPFLLRMCTETFEMRRQQSAAAAAAEVPDLLRMLLPALCHLTADDRARYVLLMLDCDQTLIEYFHHRWELAAPLLSQPRPAAQLDDPPSEPVQALTTVCGCLMNIVVMEADRVTASSEFLSLQRFLVQQLAGVDGSHLLLRSNLTVLGLLLLHRHAAAARQHQTELVRFAQAAVRFLWDAHNVDDSLNQQSVVVATRYRGVWDDLKELWFLGLQVLSQLAAEVDWLAEFILDSGWVTEIVRMFGSVRFGYAEESVIKAFEGFLVSLARASPAALEAVKAADGEKVCRTHRMRELAALVKK
ncbi:neurochondrin homolog [Amphibalanus amphitrite]|uniref:neurochondrin homolog n=1 Tax=Amphibalanus amphitrite TaxID=1232801 RepID=UPI001C8FB0D7|nr:neurochondrin homolog [Amphibalanus amphitrite]XP_043215031.1 neurochondrin homolog [Amphibalanus amphitrite]XP_043215032.1 neurochondrin homolog [Amphibalanus amphitrite]XP_043215033.1 neurochondrin homolog [Amphibalanus amphitrite]